jgi:hypothetical protein
VLLCAGKQGLGVRSERHFMGDVSHLRRKYRIRQRCRPAYARVYGVGIRVVLHACAGYDRRMLRRLQSLLKG